MEVKYNKILISLLLGIFLISLISTSFDTPVGYELLDGGSVVHIWNDAPISDYYFEKDSGLQLTNHYEDYWTRNTFCIGYYSGDEWIKIKCSDELTGFEKSITTDEETYVDATLWKDFSYQGYDLRLGVQYHLGLNDEALDITIYGKNLGIDIPFDLGFAWKVSDWEIPHEGVGGDSIFINNTDYALDGTFDLTFTNMSHTYYDEELGQDVIEYDSYIRGYDWTEFLRIDWNENLNYKTRIYGNGNQADFYFMLMVDAGHFNPGQEKSTTFQWIDAEGDYTGVSWSFPSAFDAGMDNNGTHIFLTYDFRNNVSVYQFDGTYEYDIDISVQSTNPTGLTIYGDYFWISDLNDDRVYKYNIDGTYTGENFSTSSEMLYPYGITTDGTNMWVVSADDDKIYKYYINGTEINSFSVASQTTSPGGIENNETHLFLTTKSAGGDIWIYSKAGSYQYSWSPTAANNDEYGITQNGTYYWISDNIDKKVYQYIYLDDPCTPDLQNTSWSSWSQDTCILTDFWEESRWLVQYDDNECIGNETVYQYRDDVTSCNYCSYSNINSSWSSWFALESCQSDDFFTEERNRTEHDENYDTCYLVTTIGSDLWNSGVNITHIENQETACDYCTPSIINSSWSAWSNYTCIDADMQQLRFLTEYDENDCSEVANETYFEYRLEGTCTEEQQAEAYVGGTFTPSYYPQPTDEETADLFGVFQFVVRATSGLFFPIMIAVIWIISFISILAENRKASNAWVYSSFVVFILSVFLGILSLISSQYVYTLVLMLSFGLFWLKLVNTRE